MSKYDAQFNRPDGSSRHICRRERQARRQESALVQVVRRARRTDEEQLALLDSRPGNSAKERLKLGGSV